MKLWFHDRKFRAFSEELSDAELEKTFRIDHIDGDVRQSSIIVSIAAILTAVLLLIDLYGFMNFDPEFRPTLFHIAILVAILVLMEMCIVIPALMRTTRAFYLSVFSYNLIFAVLIIIDQYSRPSNFIGSIYILILLAMYLLYAIPLRWQIPPALFMSIAMIWIFLTYKEPVYESMKLYAISTIGLINVFGIIASFTKGRYRRTSFLHLLQEKEAKDKLQDTLDKIQQLSGILLICANCLKIRDKADEWKRPDDYIREHSQAEFSHGICPECVKKV